MEKRPFASTPDRVKEALRRLEALISELRELSEYRLQVAGSERLSNIWPRLAGVVHLLRKSAERAEKREESYRRGDAVSTAQSAVRFILDARGWRQWELARYFDVHPSTVSRWLNGKYPPRPELMKKIEAYAEELETGKYVPVKGVYLRDHRGRPRKTPKRPG